MIHATPCRMLCALVISTTCALSAFAADGAGDRQCDHVLEDGKCLQIKDGKVFIDGVEQKNAVVHENKDAAEMRADLPPAPASAHRIMAQVPANKIGNELTLPRLYVFDATSGQSVAPDSLPKALAAYVRAHADKAPAAEANATPLQVVMRNAVTADGHALDHEQIGDAKYILVQWWAGWCTGCLQEGKELAQLFGDNPMPEVRWIAIETDPTRNAG